MLISNTFYREISKIFASPGILFIAKANNNKRGHEWIRNIRMACAASIVGSAHTGTEESSFLLEN